MRAVDAALLDYMYKTDEPLRETLKFVNEVRQSRDVTPLRWLPHGVTGDGDECVIAAALADIGASRLYVGWRWAIAEFAAPFGDLYVTRYQVPKIVRKFVHRFDCGRYPALSATASERLAPEMFIDWDGEFAALLEEWPPVAATR